MPEDADDRHPKRFVDDRNSVVQDAIDGLVFANSDHLNRLDAFPDIKVEMILFIAVAEVLLRC